VTLSLNPQKQFVPSLDWRRTFLQFSDPLPSRDCLAVRATVCAMCGFNPSTEHDCLASWLYVALPVNFPSVDSLLYSRHDMFR